MITNRHGTLIAVIVFPVERSEMNILHKRTQISSLAQGGSYLVPKVVYYVMIVTFVMTGNSLSPEVLNSNIFYILCGQTSEESETLQCN